LSWVGVFPARQVQAKQCGKCEGFSEREIRCILMSSAQGAYCRLTGNLISNSPEIRLSQKPLRAGTGEVVIMRFQSPVFEPSQKQMFPSRPTTGRTARSSTDLNRKHRN